MSRLAEHLLRAAVELGLRVESGNPLFLKDGTAFTADAFFRDLATEKGIYVVGAAIQPEAMAGLLEKYPVAFLSEPRPDEEYSIDEYVHLFREWGWARESVLPPEWMREEEEG